ncbi:hypothetical protein FM106_12245 [Brachybacterium faecium]|nr:hypothetical protein FM106_12245 [Brachybacterium faecium]
MGPGVAAPRGARLAPLPGTPRGRHGSGSRHLSHRGPSVSALRTARP